MNEYYNPKRRMTAHFMNLSLNTPLIKDDPRLHRGDQVFIPKCPERNSHRHIPWNYQLDWENMASMFLARPAPAISLT
jgi:hypothetical protein